MNPLKAIRAKCLDCCCGQVNEVKECPCTDCPLYPFREGRNPFRKKRELTEEEKAALGARLNAVRQKTTNYTAEDVDEETHQ